MKAMIDRLLYDTASAVESWNEQTEFNGSSQVSLATDSQWNHEALHRTAKGRYFVHWWSDWRRPSDNLRPLTEIQAAEWLVRNRYDLPAELSEATQEA